MPKHNHEVIHQIVLPFVTVDFIAMPKQVTSVWDLPDYQLSFSTKPKRHSGAAPHENDKYVIGLIFHSQKVPETITGTRNAKSWKFTTAVTSAKGEEAEKLAKSSFESAIEYAIRTRAIMGPLANYSYDFEGMSIGAKTAMWNAAFYHDYPGTLISLEVDQVTGEISPWYFLALGNGVRAKARPLKSQSSVNAKDCFFGKVLAFGNTEYQFEIYRGRYSTAQRGLFKSMMSENDIQAAYVAALKKANATIAGQVFNLSYNLDFIFQTVLRGDPEFHDPADIAGEIRV